MRSSIGIFCRNVEGSQKIRIHFEQLEWSDNFLKQKRHATRSEYDNRNLSSFVTNADGAVYSYVLTPSINSIAPVFKCKWKKRIVTQ